MIKSMRSMELRSQLLVHGALIVVLALMLGTSPARAGVTIYDISILLYQPHPWANERLHDGMAATVPGRAVWRAGRPDALRRVDDAASRDRAGQPATSGVGYQAATHGTPERKDLSGPYSFFVYAGPGISNGLTRFYKFDIKDTQLLAAGMTARLYRFDFGLEIEGEVGLARRFGQDELWEGWVAVGIRWRDFPWNHILQTTMGFALLGVDYTTEVPPFEIEFSKNEGEQLLHFLALELTLALPEHPDVALMLRVHHRSSVLGLYGDGGGTNFVTAGMRFQY